MTSVLHEMELLDQFSDENAAEGIFMKLSEKLEQYHEGRVVESVGFPMEIVIQHEKVVSGMEAHGISGKDKPEEQDSETTKNDSPGPEDKLLRVKLEDGQLSTLCGGVFNCKGKNLKIKVPLTTPSRTISVLAYLVLDNFINQPNISSSNGIRLYKNKSELHQANKMIKRAFIELYKEVGYLRKFRTLNMLAFLKILKKFDKISWKQAQPIYFKEVEASYFNSTDKVDALIDEVEQLFVKHFAEDDHWKAMKYLRPHHHKGGHVTTFFIGLFAGCLFALLAGYSVMAHFARLYTDKLHPVYMETTYPILSIFSLVFLHLFLYGCNVLMWRKARINYNFIFEFNPTKELKYRDVFLICTASMSTVVGVMFIHSYLTINGLHLTHVHAIPGLLFLLFLALLVCPLNVFYSSSRYKFLKVIRNIILAPLYKVVMVDFFVADQLCSQVPMLRDVAYVSCYYITGSYRTQDYAFCTRNAHYRHLPYIVSFLPYYWRAMQCARRWFDEGQACHLVNMGKYISAMLAASARVAYDNEKNGRSLFILIAMSSTATVYQLYWDFMKDWGLLQFNSKNRWLRNDLMLQWKFVYYLSMGLNFILRLAWLQIVLHFNFRGIDYRVTSFFLAALEIIRRCQGNFYRLENEHLNNAGNFRAVKAVPLPFHEVDQD